MITILQRRAMSLWRPIEVFLRDAQIERLSSTVSTPASIPRTPAAIRTITRTSPTTSSTTTTASPTPTSSWRRIAPVASSSRRRRPRQRPAIRRPRRASARRPTSRPRIRPWPVASIPTTTIIPPSSRRSTPATPIPSPRRPRAIPAPARPSTPHRRRPIRARRPTHPITIPSLKPWRSSPRRRRRPRKPSPREHNAHLQLRAVKLRIMHFRNRALCIVDLFVQDVCGAAVYVEGGVHGHAQVFDGAVFGEDFADVGFFDVAG